MSRESISTATLTTGGAIVGGSARYTPDEDGLVRGVTVEGLESTSRNFEVELGPTDPAVS